MEQPSTTFIPAADVPAPSPVEGIKKRLAAGIAELSSEIRRLPAEYPHWIAVGIPLFILAVYVYSVAWDVWFNPAAALWFQPFVPLAVAYAIWRDRFHVQAAYSELTEAFVEGSLRKRGHLIVSFLGCALVVLGALLMLSTLSVVGFVVLLVGGIYYLYGSKILRILGQPLFYLIFMIPPWLTLVGMLTQKSQILSQLVAGQVLQVFMSGVHSAGTTITLPNYILEVTPAASGFNVLAPVLVLTAFLALFKRLHLSWTGILLIVAWGITSALNILRLVIVGTIGGGNPDLAATLRDTNPLILAALAFYLTYLVMHWILRPAQRRRTEFEEDLSWAARMQPEASDVYDDEGDEDDEEDDE